MRAGPVAGCLSEAALAAIERAPAGGLAPELSAHLAACSRCQERLLRRDAGLSPRGARRTGPPLWRTVVALALALLLAAAALLAARWLGG